MRTTKAESALSMHVRGEGDTIVMLHGWGMHAGVWATLAEGLSRRYRVVCIDLPGHGQSRDTCPLTLEAVVDALLAQIDGAVHWLGWSLGGSLLMRLLGQAPERVKSFILLSASPVFVQQQNWPHGIEAQVLEGFAQDLRADYQKTLQRFLALQTLSSLTAKNSLRQLRETMFAVQDPDVDCLLQGLQILQQADLRPELEATAARGLIVLGQRDQLVPASVAGYYRGLSCHPQVEVLAGGGHALFLSQPVQTLQLITTFISSDGGSFYNE